MTPHLSEELWTLLGGEGLVVQAPWPQADPEMMQDDLVTLPIQINGKRRAEIDLPPDMAVAEVEKRALEVDAVVRALEGAQPRKVIVVPGRIVNVVI
jgi:leucyl-tRNA synthetase